jgi:multisubunit Na+/H+ antiporter MnhB subunit
MINMSVGNTVYCINCGEEIAADTEFCPECGSTQAPDQVEAVEQDSEESGFTSWAPGFKPGSTLRNVIVGLAYLAFFYIGIFALTYGYLKKNPESGSTFAWVLGILLIIAGLGGFTDGTTQGIIGGIIAVVVGVAVLPIIREKIGVGSPPPGIEEGNTARRNALISVGYGIGALAIAGAALPETESTTSGTSAGDGSSSDGGDSGGGSSGGGDSNEESYPSAFYYDESTGLVFEDDINAELDSIGSLYIRGTVRNESGQDYEYVQVTWSVLDSSGAKIADALANTSGLSAGQSWRYEALAASADEVDSYELQDITAY